MLLDGHNLYAVVTVSCNAREHLLAELGVCSNFLLFLSHTYVALIDEQRGAFGNKLPVLELILLLGSPHLRTEYLCCLILHHATHPCRNTLAAAALPVNLHFVVLTMSKCLLGHSSFPHAAGKLLQLILGTLFPVGKVADEHNLCSVRSPLTEHPPSRCAVQAKVEITCGKVRQSLSAVLCQLFFSAEKIAVASFYTQIIRSQIAVAFNEFQHCYKVLG